MFRGWKNILVAGLMSSSLFAQQTPKSVWFPASPIGTPLAPAGTIATPMEMLPQMAPIFVEDGDISSSLVIVNNSAIKAGATIQVRDLSGNEIAKTHRALKPHEQQEISLQTLLAGVATPPVVGSVTVAQDPELKGMTVASQLLLTSRRGKSPAYVDEELAMPGIDGSGTLRGVTDASVGTALLAVTSNVGWTQHVTLHCLSAKAEYKPVVLTLAPQATLLVSNCSGQTIDRVASFQDGIKSGSEERIEGYELGRVNTI